MLPMLVRLCVPHGLFFPPAPAPSAPHGLLKTSRTRWWAATTRTKALRAIPADYRLGIVPASDTGAVEMALWSMLGARPVDLFAWESFSEDWITDTVKQLKLKDARTFKAAYGALPDMTQYDPTHDAVFVWNGPTSGGKL